MRSFGAFALVGVAASQDVFLNKNGPSASDLKRAVAKPRKQFQGGNYQEMNAVLNKQLLSSGKTMRACDDFTLAELHNVRVALFDAREPALDAVYKPKNDGRKMTMESAQELAQQNDRYKEIAEQNPSLIPMLRDGLCHETVMWYVHHLTEDAREEVDMELPALPASEKHSLHTANPSNLENEAAKLYNQALTCQSCHNGADVIKGATWPIWPEELYYEAIGYGAFPFFPVAHAPTNATYVRRGWYSLKQKHQRIWHSICDLSLSGGPRDGPCTTLYVPSGDIHVYTENSCCRAVTTGDEHNMPTERQDWMMMEDGPTTVQYSGTYYKGEALLYVATAYSTRWYVTKPDGTPIEKGEGPVTENPLIHCDHMSIPTATPHFCVYQEYDPNSFDLSPIDPSLFVDPSQCSDIYSHGCAPAT